MKAARAAAKRKFTRKANLLEGKLLVEDSVETLQLLHEETMEAYRVLEAKNDSLAQHYADEVEDSEDLVADVGAYIEESEKRKLLLHSSFWKLKKSQASVKVKSLPPPNFSGEMRIFGTFLKDYDRLMYVKYGNDPFAFISCLSGEARECVKGVEDSYDAMMDRLKEKYGNPCKVTESIIREVKLLRPIPEGDSKKLVQSVNIIERAWLDMCRMDLESEMSSVAIVTLVERILPRRLQHDWVLKAGEPTPPGEDEVPLFKKLLNFLLYEKWVCEYLDSELRSNNSKVVANVVSGESTEMSSHSAEVVEALRDLKVSQEKTSNTMAECLIGV